MAIILGTIWRSFLAPPCPRCQAAGRAQLPRQAGRHDADSAVRQERTGMATTSANAPARGYSPMQNRQPNESAKRIRRLRHRHGAAIVVGGFPVTLGEWASAGPSAV